MQCVRTPLHGILKMHQCASCCCCAGTCELAAALSPSAAVRTLDVNENGIGEKGAAALAEALQAGSQLRVLRLRGNAIGDAGAAALGHALATEPVLEELDVGHNDVGPIFLQCLSTTLHIICQCADSPS